MNGSSRDSSIQDQGSGKNNVRKSESEIPLKGNETKQVKCHESSKCEDLGDRSIHPTH